jgi:predicted transcriptional regulator
MQVSEVMNKQVFKANIDDTIKQVSELMRDKDIGALPVFKQNDPVGFVTDRDLVISGIAEGLSFDDPISKAMNDQVVCIEADKEIQEASKLMQQQQITRLLVVDQQRQPVGMLSLHDISLTGDEELESDTLSGIKEG